MPSNRFAVMTALGAIGAIAGSVSVTASASCTEGMDTIAWTVQIKDEGDAHAELCENPDQNVACGADTIYANYDAGTKLSFDDGNNWQVKSGTEVVLNAQGYKGKHALSAELQPFKLLDLVKLNEGLDAPVHGVANCDSTFTAALNAWLALQTPCDQVGNARQDEPGACATGDDACVDGFERQGDICKKTVYEEDSEKSEALRRADKRSWFNVMRKAGMRKRSAEADADFTKRKFKGMKINTRAHFKDKMQQRVNANLENKKKHVMRKEERMPVSIADGSDDLKAAFKEKLRSKFGADRDVGIIVGPENNKDSIACSAAYDDILDDDDCITYDAAIDGDTTDVHVLGSDTSYNVGGIAIGDKYVPVVKQTLADADAETFDMSCWGGDAWENPQVEGAGWEAGDKVSCTVKRSGVVVKVDTIVGSSVTVEVDNDKCDVGFGCLTDDTADPLVCLTGNSFGCEECQIPEANGEVVAAPCIAQKCVAGEGAFVPNSSPAGAIDLAAFDYGDGAMGRGGIPFDVNQDPSDCGKVGEDKCSGNDNPQGNPNCVSCPPGYYSPDNNGYCFPHKQCSYQLDGTTRLINATATTEGSCAPCADGTYAANEQTNCVAHTQCGKQLAVGDDAAATRLTGADPTTAGSCADCADDTYAALPTDNCVANTQCGFQLAVGDEDAVNRLRDATRVAAGTCAPCADGTYAADGQTSCESYTQCGKGADGSSRLIDASATTAGTCATCAATTFAERGADDCACDEGFGCVSDNPGSCRVPLVCESCEIPKANNAVDKTECAAQVCNSGFGYDESEGFDSTLDPTNRTNSNCRACDDGKFSPGGTGQCVDYSTTCLAVGYTRDPNHNHRDSDRPCKDITPPTLYIGDVADIDENSAAGKVVFTATASDTSGTPVILTLGGTDANAFLIDSDTGVVTTNVVPDFEIKNLYSIIVTATDAAQQSTSVSKTVNILNLDEVAPRFRSGPASEILESAAAGTAVYTAITLDNYDISGGVTYTLSGSDALDIDEHSGQVTLKGAISEGEYPLTVTATDAAGNEAQKIVSLTVRPDKDQDGIDDEHDECFIIGCTAQQLTDAYAMIEKDTECSNSRRVHARANEIRKCVTTECGETHILQIKSAIETKQSEC